ncbi:MAG: NAD(P)-dependent oxidoreductase [Desulfamplus sp.]|nr:NAD(P)-dependent oxidoreductase [Desulfamplus sp.]
MRIFITGGTGFIGKALTKLLIQRGYEILVLTRGLNKSENREYEQIQYVEGNLQDCTRLENIIKGFNPYFVIHLAWEGLPDYSMEFCRKNLEYGINLFNASVKAGCLNILSTGSCWEYSARKGSLSEESKLDATSIFPAVKNVLRFYGEALVQKTMGKFYWLRLFYVYGPGQRKSSLIPHIIDSLHKGETPQCRTPYNRNDFVYIDDVVRAIAGIIEKQPDGTVYNIGSGFSCEVMEVIRQVSESKGHYFDVERYSGLDSTMINDKADENTINFWADISRLSKDTGWVPEYSLISGIEATLSGYHMEIK